MTSRSTRRATLAFLALSAFATAPAEGGESVPDFKVIVHAAHRDSRVPRELLADAFLKNITRWDGGEAIRPVDQRPDTLVRRKFSDAVLRRSVAAVKTYWQQRIFSGRGVPPPELDSDEAVVHYVETHPGAVGYISGSASSGKTKVVVVTH